jgi:hypothetical protein
MALIADWGGSDTTEYRTTSRQQKILGLLQFNPFSVVRSIVDPSHMVRIRIGESVPLTSGSGSCSFRQWLSRCQQK